jgi:MFS superfamily sulfate permease-like transporter
LKVIIFDFWWMNNIDSSWLHMIKNLVSRLKKTNIKVYMTNVRVKVTEKFHHTWFLEDFWVKNIFTNIDEAVEHVIEKFWDSTDAEILLKYKKDKTKKPELDKHMIKKIDKI